MVSLSVRSVRTSHVSTILRTLSTVVSSHELGFHDAIRDLSLVDNVDSACASDIPYSVTLGGGVKGKEQPRKMP